MLEGDVFMLGIKRILQLDAFAIIFALIAGPVEFYRESLENDLAQYENVSNMTYLNLSGNFEKDQIILNTSFLIDDEKYSEDPSLNAYRALEKNNALRSYINQYYLDFATFQISQIDTLFEVSGLDSNGIPEIGIYQKAKIEYLKTTGIVIESGVARYISRPAKDMKSLTYSRNLISSIGNAYPIADNKVKIAKSNKISNLRFLSIIALSIAAILSLAHLIKETPRTEDSKEKR